MNASHVQDWSADAPHAHGSAFGLVHRLLRGRYLMTLALAGVFAVIGGIVGFVMQSPLYKSDAVIKIEPVLPKILYETEQSSAPRMFASFVNTQAELIKAQGVIEYAMASDRWKQVAAVSGITTVDGFKSGLIVRTSRSAQELITVSYEHQDARVAQAANQAVLDAYMALHGSQDRLDTEKTMGVLETRRDTLRQQKSAVDDKIREITTQWGTDQLNQLVRVAIDTVTQLNGEQQRLNDQLTELEKLAAQADDPQGLASSLTEERAAQIDPNIAELIRLRRSLESQKSDLIASGVRSGHRLYKQVESGLSEVNAQIQQRLTDLRDAIIAGETAAGGSAGLTVDELRVQIARVGQRLQDARATQTKLGEDSLNLRDYENQRADLEKDIAFVENRIDAIRTESQVENFSDVSGRISIASPAHLPRDPTSDKRIKLAGAGFVGAGSVPVAAMLLLGLAGRRIRFSDDGILDAAHSRIVGVLPDLGESIKDQELAEASAFAVHQIRSQLQILYGTGGTSVFSVTSPAPGDGKTSMIIALGLSFAESGDRTLLIDLDLIGRGLSLHFGHPTAPSLAEAAATGADLAAMVQPSNFDRLSILPAGMGDDMRISRLSPTVIRRIVETFRDKYDTVLIDSGPILGSIEAGFLAPATDGMLMVVGRGQLRPLVKRAVDQIQSVGGQVIATVFNRASMVELRQSASSMSVHFSRQASRQAAEQAVSPNRGVGPLAGSMFSGRTTPERGEP